MKLGDATVHLRSWTAEGDNIFLTEIRADGNRDVPLTLTLAMPAPDPEAHTVFPAGAGFREGALWATRENNLTGAAEFCETFLNGARTPAGLAVGAAGDGWGVAMAALGNERGTSLVAQQMGFGREVARLTEALGVPSAAVRYRLVDAWIGARIARWQILRLMETVLRDGDPGLRPSVCKVFASSFHQRLGALALDLLGAGGQVTGPGYELSEIQRTALACLAESIYGGASEIQMNLIAERGLGLPREGTQR